MSRFLALLRGVNVGKGNRVPMAELRRMLGDLGYTDVATLLNSGNAVFTSSDRAVAHHAKVIAASLQEEFAVSTPVIVKSAAEFRTIIAENPVTPGEAEHSRFLIAFANDGAALRSLEPLLPLVVPPERLIITAHAAYLHCAAGILESKVGAAMLGKAGQGVTTRNWATVLKLSALLDAV